MAVDFAPGPGPVAPHLRAPAPAISGLRIVFHRLSREVSDLKPALQLRPASLPRLDGLDHTVVEMRRTRGLLQEGTHLKIESRVTTTSGAFRAHAVLMPPTLVTGIFGMNTKGLPFTDLDTASCGIALIGVVLGSPLTSS